MESYYNAMSGRYERIVIDKRVLDRPLASVAIVDMREEYADGGPDVILSRALSAALASRGIDLSSKQETKTRSALEFFAKQLENGKTKAGRRQPGANTSAASTTTKSRA